MRFLAGVLLGVVVAGVALVAASVMLDDLPGAAPPGEAQTEVGEPDDLGPGAEPALEPPAFEPEPEAFAPSALAPVGEAAPAEAAPPADAAPLPPGATAAPNLAAPSRGPEGAAAPLAAEEGPSVIERTVPVLPAEPSPEADAPPATER